MLEFKILSFFLENLANENYYCVILATHDISAAQRADQVLSLKGGSLVGSKVFKAQIKLFVRHKA